MAVVYVNGKRVDVPDGRSISIVNGQVFVDGKRYTENDKFKEVNIVIEGGCNSLQVDACDRVEVKGNFGDILKVG